MKTLRTLLIALLCLMISLPAFAGQNAAQAETPLTLAEVEQFNQQLLEKAIADELETFQTEEGYLARGNMYEVLLGSPDIAPDSLVFSSALVYYGASNQELSGPRGSKTEMALGDLLALFANDNPDLTGTPQTAVLYIRGALPAAVHTGFILRDGQKILLVEYNVYYQAGEGVSRAGIQYTVEDEKITAARSFVSRETLSQAEAQEEIDLLLALQEKGDYRAYVSQGGTPLDREDLTLAGLDFLDTAPDIAKAVLGAPVFEDRADNSDGSVLITQQWPGMEAVFQQQDAEVKVYRLTATDAQYEGPRGIKTGNTLAQVIGRFEHGSHLPQIGGTLYGDAENQNPPYGLMISGLEGVQLYYVLAIDEVKVGLLLDFVDDVLVSMSITYL
jgi:hypothetical protein